MHSLLESSDNRTATGSPASIHFRQSRTHMPLPMRQAIAIAIELEETHDKMAELVGHSFPLPNRILPAGKKSGTKRRLNLPRNLSGEALARLQEERLVAIEHLHDQFYAGTGNSEENDLLALVTEAREMVVAQQYIRVSPRKGPSRNMDPEARLTADELLHRRIISAADNPPPAVKAPEKTSEQFDQKLSIVMDLMTEGLIEYHGINPEKLYKAIHAFGWFSKSGKPRPGPRIFATPAMRSNQYPTIDAFGTDFPKALYHLRGNSLETQSLEMIAADAGKPEDVWQYRAAHASSIVLTRNIMITGMGIHDLERRALTDIFDDPRFHSALVIERADRRHSTDLARTITSFKLRPGYGYLLPPGSKTRPYKMKRPYDLRRPGHGFTGAYKDLIFADLITEELKDRKMSGRRYRIDPVDGGGLILRMADDGAGAMYHSFLFHPETLKGGPEAVSVRFEKIIESLQRTKDRRLVKATQEQSGDSPQALIQSHGDESSLERLGRLHGPDAADHWAKCTHVCALIQDELRSDAPADPDAQFHFQEGLLAIKAMRLSDDVFYKLERFDRTMGKIKHAIGVLEVDRTLTPGAIEQIRDGSASLIVKDWPEFGRAQVRKISQHEHMTRITIRVPIFDRPQDP